MTSQLINDVYLNRCLEIFTRVDTKILSGEKNAGQDQTDVRFVRDNARHLKWFFDNFNFYDIKSDAKPDSQSDVKTYENIKEINDDIIEIEYEIKEINKTLGKLEPSSPKSGRTLDEKIKNLEVELKKAKDELRIVGISPARRLDINAHITKLDTELNELYRFKRASPEDQRKYAKKLVTLSRRLFALKALKRNEVIIKLNLSAKKLKEYLSKSPIYKHFTDFKNTPLNQVQKQIIRNHLNRIKRTSPREKGPIKIGGDSDSDGYDSEDEFSINSDMMFGEAYNKLFPALKLNIN